MIRSLADRGSRSRRRRFLAFAVSERRRPAPRPPEQREREIRAALAAQAVEAKSLSRAPGCWLPRAWRECFGKPANGLPERDAFDPAPCARRTSPNLRF